MNELEYWSQQTLKVSVVIMLGEKQEKSVYEYKTYSYWKDLDESGDYILPDCKRRLYELRGSLSNMAITSVERIMMWHM